MNWTFREDLTKDLHLHVYNVQWTQEVRPTHHAQRREFVQSIMEHQKEDVDISNHIIFSDEAIFHLVGPVNRQNLRA